MPFYTRPKQMIPTSGYTGNNVYVAYPREAKLQLRLLDKTTEQRLQDKDGKNLIDTISIIQVRRCVNPKGVWRSWDNDESFHVVMNILPREGADKFERYDYKGPWRAKVEIDNLSALGRQMAMDTCIGLSTLRWIFILISTGSAQIVKRYVLRLYWLNITITHAITEYLSVKVMPRYH